MKNRTRIYYIPGWISLMMLLVLCTAFMHQRGVFEKEAIIKVYSCRAKDLGKGFIAKLPLRQFSNVFTICKAATPEISAIQSKIQHLAAEKDTIEGIKIHFTAVAKHQSLVTILDILRTEKVVWWLIEGNIWVWYNPPPPPTIWFTPIFICGTAEMAQVQLADRLKKEQEAQTAQVMKNICCALWASWLFFIALMISAIDSSPSRYKK